MYRLLIADDEKRINKLIRNLVDWDVLGIEIAGMADDGKAALDLILEKKPDIVITDIRMPGMSGIDLICRVRELGIDVDFIIISGYRQFDYARCAIRYGVEDYLVKPIDADELTEMIRRIIAKREREKERTLQRVCTEERLKEQVRLVQKNYLNELVAGDIGGGSHDAPPDICHDEAVTAFVVKPDMSGGPESFTEYQALLRKIEIITDKIFEDSCITEISCVKNDGVYVMAEVKDEIEFSRCLREMRKKILVQNTAFFPSFTVTVGIREIRDGIAEISGSIREAEEALWNRLILGPGGVLHIGDLPVEISCSVENIFTHTLRSMFLEKIEICDYESVGILIHDIGIKCCTGKNVTGKLIRDLCSTLTQTYIYGAGMGGDEVKAEEIKQQWSRVFCMSSTWREVFDGLAEYLRNDMKRRVEERDNVCSKPVRVIQQYLQEHYAEPVKLEDVSGIAGFNSSYFSALFKKETGKNFSEYLIDLRVARAKVLLTDTQISVTDVAAQVGYSDFKYFTRIFRRESGITPADYRKLYKRII